MVSTNRKPKTLSHIRDSPDVSSSAMEGDPAREWQRMQEVYSQMSEDELQSVADKAYELTEIAQQALQWVLKERSLAITPRFDRPTRPERLAMHTESEFIDADLATVYVAFSPTEAYTATATLDRADIPWRLGRENLERVEDYSGSYEDGVSVNVLRWDWEYAKSLFPPQNLPERPEYPEGPVTCPKCQSDDVVLDSAEPKLPFKDAEKFCWHCEACGYVWQDDGVEKLGVADAGRS